MSQLFSLNTVVTEVKRRQGHCDFLLPLYLARHPGGRWLKYLTWGKIMDKMLARGMNEKWPGRYPILSHPGGQKVQPRKEIESLRTRAKARRDKMYIFITHIPVTIGTSTRPRRK